MSNFFKKHQEECTINSSIPLQNLASLVINLIESIAEQMYMYNFTNEEYVKLQKTLLLYF